MTGPQAWIPDPETRAERNAALLATGTDSGFCDESGRAAPWPDDIEEWRPATSEPVTHQPEEQPF